MPTRCFTPPPESLLWCVSDFPRTIFLFFAVVAQVLPAPSDPRPRGSVVAYMVCVGFADLYFCPCVDGSGSIGRRFQWARINGLADRMKDKIPRHVLSLSYDFCSAS